MARVLLGDELANFALEHQQRRVSALRAIGSLGEEGAQLQDSLRSVRVLVGHGATDRRGMNADLLGHFLNHHRPEPLNALIEKILLAAHNDFAGPKDGAFSLRDVAHELQRGAEALLHVLLHLFGGSFGGKHLPVAPAEPQAGQILLVHGDYPNAVALDEHHIRLDEPGLLAIVLAAGPGIQRADKLDCGMRLGGGNLDRLCQVFYVALLQQVQMPVHNQRGYLDAAPALLDARLGFSAEAAMDILFQHVRAG